jgi:hypothetical protein
MSGKVLNLSYEVELQTGEKLSLPDSLLVCQATILA